ncbi:MAG: hypothetical protein SWX82_17575 [Cyanobacteriota bacterium]|nr:hypothetical protein [Cyanobacteriota bacterium]
MSDRDGATEFYLYPCLARWGRKFGGGAFSLVVRYYFLQGVAVGASCSRARYSFFLSPLLFLVVLDRMRLFPVLMPEHLLYKCLSKINCALTSHSVRLRDEIIYK